MPATTETFPFLPPSMGIFNDADRVTAMCPFLPVVTVGFRVPCPRINGDSRR